MAYSIRQVWAMYAQIIANMVGIPVVISGKDAYYDGQAIHVPMLSEDNPDLIQAGWGYLYHEGGHANQSDMNLFQEVAREGPLKKNLLNVIEDIFIEHWLPNAFYTSKAGIDAMNQYILDKGGYTVPAEDAEPAEIFSSYILYQGLAYHNDWPALIGIANKTEKVFRSVFSRAVATRLNALLSTYLPKIQGTKDSVDLVNRIIVMLEEEEQADNNQPNDDNPQSGDNSQDQGDNQKSGDNSQAQANQQGDDDSNQSNDGSNQQSDDSNQNSDGQQATPDNKPSQDDQPSSSNDALSDDTQSGGQGQSASQVIRQTLDATEDKLPEDRLKVLRDDMSEGSTNQHMARPAPKGSFCHNNNLGERAYNNALIHSNAARKQLQRLVEASVRTRPSVRDYGVRIDQNRMHRALFGDMNVFSHKKYAKGKSAAVHLLLDASPSMDSRLQTAIEATIAIALAMERIPGVNVAVSRFPIDGHYDGIDFRNDVQPLVRHGERVINQIDSFNIDTMGGTPLGDALWYALSEVSQQKEERKIVLVVTDGRPSNSRALHNAVEVAEQLNIETMALGIQVKSVDKYFPVSGVIDDIDELADALFEMMTNTLVQVA
jgi:cobaltochelatase CobT